MFVTLATAKLTGLLRVPVNAVCAPTDTYSSHIAFDELGSLTLDFLSEHLA
jgi:hypothetical protein